MEELENKMKYCLDKEKILDISLKAKDKEELKNKTLLIFNLLQLCKKDRNKDGYLYLYKRWNYPIDNYNCCWRITYRDEKDKFYL